MAQSRKRKHHTSQKRSEVPSSQRTSGHFFWSVLLGLFAGLVGFFAAGANYIVIAICLIAGAALGYRIGRNMERRR